MSRKYQPIDIVKLYATQGPAAWNKWLTDCFINNDTGSLQRVYYGMQVGMDDCAKKKLNGPSVDIMFIRWTRSIEKTLKKIWRKRDPNPLDNPSNVGKYGMETLARKRRRDQDHEKWLAKMRF